MRTHVGLEAAWRQAACLLRSVPGAEVGWRRLHFILNAAADQRFQLILRQQAEGKWSWTRSLFRFELVLHLRRTNYVVARARRHWSRWCSYFFRARISEIG